MNISHFHVFVSIVMADCPLNLIDDFSQEKGFLFSSFFLLSLDTINQTEGDSNICAYVKSKANNIRTLIVDFLFKSIQIYKGERCSLRVKFNACLSIRIRSLKALRIKVNK